jgi:predicted negative regulator of RcsB-dependent stress response
MSEESPFNLKHASEVAYVEPSGVLDQLNLHPSIVSFIRENKRILQVTGVVIVVMVVTISLYKSYRQNRLENGASSLSISMEAEGDTKVEALEHVATDFSGTPSGLWAATELGHLAMKAGEYERAAKQYQGVRDQVKPSNPMYGLLTFGIAQANEAGKKYDLSSAMYAELKDVEGFKDEGYIGMARVLEAQNENQKALAVYEEYLGTFLGENVNERAKQMIQEKITRIRVQE